LLISNSKTNTGYFVNFIDSVNGAVAFVTIFSCYTFFIARYAAIKDFVAVSFYPLFNKSLDVT